MSATIDCPRCRRPSDPGARFCMHCGANTTPQVHCPTCNQLQPAGARFCMSCGATMAGATYQSGMTDGAVIEGIWSRGPDEFIRRVLPEDCRTFLGNRVVRIPAGTVGVVIIGGRVERVLPPGEQTAMPLFERITNFFSGKGATAAFYLLDLRPIPIPFALQTRPTENGRTVQAQVLVSFQIPRGDHQAIGMFIDSVLGARSGFSAGDLYNLLRPEVTSLASQVLERMAGEGELRYADAEAKIRQALSDQLARRYGLLIDVSVAPLTTTASLSFHLGEGEKAALFTSDGEAVELDIVVRVQGQHEDFAPERLQAALKGTAAARLRTLPFVQLSTGEGFSTIEEALRTDVARELASFGMQLVSINVIDVRSRTGVWLLGARAELKHAEEELGVRRAWIDQSAREVDLAGLVLDQNLRRQQVERESKLRGLAAELDGSRRESGLRREDAFDRDKDSLADRQRRQELGHGQAKLDIAQAELSAQKQLRVEAAERTVVEAKRTTAQADALDGIRHATDKSSLQFEGRADLTRKEMELAAEQKRKSLELESQTARQRAQDGSFATRQRDEAAFDDHSRRAHLNEELADHAETRQEKKLRAMAELDMKMAEQEQHHELKLRESLHGLSEREMIAMQAAQLAKAADGGAAWAQALAAGEAQREKEQRLADQARHASEVKDLMRDQMSSLHGVMESQLDRLTRLTEQAMQSASAQQHNAGAASVYGQSMDAMAKVAASRAAPAATPLVTNSVTPAPAQAASTVSCAGCGAAFRSDARFCPSCGAEKSS